MKPFTTIAALIFALMALVHLYRLFDGFPVTIHGHQLGQGVSVVALIITATLSFGLFREARR